MTKIPERIKILQETVNIVDRVGEELRDARIAEIDAVENLATSQATAILSEPKGSNAKERDANLRGATLTRILGLAEAKKNRITAETAYKAAKRSLRVMELIYKVQNDG